jgi:hypothetical protein
MCVFLQFSFPRRCIFWIFCMVFIILLLFSLKNISLCLITIRHRTEKLNGVELDRKITDNWRWKIKYRVVTDLNTNFPLRRIGGTLCAASINKGNNTDIFKKHKWNVGKMRKTVAVAYSKVPTPWSRVPVENLTGSQLVNKFPAFYGTRRFITAFTSALHLSLFFLYKHFATWYVITVSSC